MQKFRVYSSTVKEKQSWHNIKVLRIYITFLMQRINSIKIKEFPKKKKLFFNVLITYTSCHYFFKRKPPFFITELERTAYFTCDGVNADYIMKFWRKMTLYLSKLSGRYTLNNLARVRASNKFFSHRCLWHFQFNVSNFLAYSCFLTLQVYWFSYVYFSFNLFYYNSTNNKRLGLSGDLKPNKREEVRSSIAAPSSWRKESRRGWLHFAESARQWPSLQRTTNLTRCRQL